MQYQVWKQLKEMGTATSKNIADKLDVTRHAAQQALRRLRQKRVVGFEQVPSAAGYGRMQKEYFIIDKNAELPQPQVVEV